MMAAVVLGKQDNRELCFGLTHAEFRCKCKYQDCGHTVLTHALKKAFLDTRTEFNKPISIHSGFRCQRHNSDVGGVKKSRHMSGEAIDIAPHADNPYFEHELERLEQIARKHFGFVLRYKTFIHCDVRSL